jgi:hypothetical protein
VVCEEGFWSKWYVTGAVTIRQGLHLSMWIVEDALQL